MPAKISTEKELEVLLRSLGSEPDDVAKTLRDAGIYGKRDEPSSCPVANWLAQETGLCPYVEREAVALYRLAHAPAAVPLIELDMPLAVAEFIGRFDNQEYADLQEPGALDFDD